MAESLGVETAVAKPGKKPRRSPNAEFVEMGLSERIIPSHQIASIQLEDREGRRLSIPIENLSSAELLGLATSLWQSR